MRKKAIIENIQERIFSDFIVTGLVLYLQVRRWIKSPMVSMEKHQTSSLKYPGATVMHIPQGEPDIEVPFCQMCFNDHTFPKGIISQDSESCSWEGPRSCNVSRPLSCILVAVLRFLTLRNARLFVCFNYLVYTLYPTFLFSQTPVVA